MEKNSKYIYLSLKEKNGEYEYTHRGVHELLDNKKITAKKFVKNYAKDFYGGIAKHDNEGYYFFDGEVFVEVDTWNFLNEGEYNILRKYL